jgi:sugar fermentation stimulation protein A
MVYSSVTPAVFLSRPNRFVAEVLLDGKLLACHVKNTGRCRELLLPGVTVWLSKSENPNRKYAYDLIAVQKGQRLINIDSQAPNHAFSRWAREGHFVPNLTMLRPECTHGSSRFDFYWESGHRRGFVEVKGVTLEEDGAVYFPDAPTLRGIKHVEGLTNCIDEGYEAAVFFVIQLSDVKFLAPNDKTQPEFGTALARAAKAGVRLYAMDCDVRPNSMKLRGPVPIQLEGIS